MKKYLVYHDDGNLSSYEPETKKQILDYYNNNEWRFKDDGIAHYPKLKTLKEVREYFAVSIETYKNQQYEF